MFVRLMLACFFAVGLLAPLMASAQIDDEEFEPTPLPYLPNATFGQRNIAVQLTSDSIFDEPLFMYFQVFGFSISDDAALSLETIYEHYFDVAQKELDTSAWYDYRGVSVGRIGDERLAFATEGRDIVMGSTAKRVHVFVQMGPNILYLQSMSLGGETLEFVAKYLDEFLIDATDNPTSLLPTLSVLPVGWELPETQPENFLSQLIAPPTPTPVPPSPTPIPTLAPTPTPEPLTAEVMITLPARAVEDLGKGACQGKSGFAFMREGQTLEIATASEDGEVLDVTTLSRGTRIKEGFCAWTVSVGPIYGIRTFDYFFIADGHLLGKIGQRLFRGDESPVLIEVNLSQHPDLLPTDAS